MSETRSHFGICPKCGDEFGVGGRYVEPGELCAACEYRDDTDESDARGWQADTMEESRGER